MTNSSTAKYKILRETFGFNKFRPGQEEVIDTLLSGHNALAVMPTGSGKSFCFQVPALIRPGLTVVISPLVALMQDQVTALRILGVAAVSINSSQSRAENVAAWRQVAAGQIKIIYLAPERMMTERMLDALAKLEVGLIAIDEAHCISQWGPSFRPEYELLGNLRKHFPKAPIAALTATADPATQADILDKLFNGNAGTIVLGFDRPNIKIAVEMKNNWKSQMLAFTKARKGQSGIIYCLSRKKTEEAAALLCKENIPALPYHAGLPSEIREQHQNIFMTEPGVVIVATIAFGMGIDKADVRYVFHTDLPSTLEAYYQEIGRAGRDGEPAEAQMLYGLQDIRMRRLFIDQENSADDRKRREHQKLDALLGFCEAPECRRRTLLGYFGEQSNACGNCDRCLNPTFLVDGTEEAKLLMRVIRQTGMIYGVTHLINVLRGTNTEKVLKAGHQDLETFCCGKNHKVQEWRSIIRQLVAAGFLNTDIENYGGLKITKKGRVLESGLETFRYRLTQFTSKLKTHPMPPSPETGTTLTQPQIALLAKLKHLRLELACQRRVPAYLIFTDRTLAHMARIMPRTESEFAEINGVGKAKLKLFASLFLKVINSTFAGPDKHHQ